LYKTSSQSYQPRADRIAEKPDGQKLLMMKKKFAAKAKQPND